MVRVRPDVTGINRTFDWLVPPAWHDDGRARQLEVGSRVRVQLQGRRVGGWIVELDPPPDPEVTAELQPLRRWSGRGPDASIIELAGWAGRRWAGSPVRFLRTASPPRNVMRSTPTRRVTWDGPVEPWAAQAFEGAGSVLRVAPAGDRWPVVLAAAALGNPLIIVPTADVASALAARLRNQGMVVAHLPDDWALARGGAITVGTRAAAWGPAHEPGSILVLDEHDDAHREERTPTWHARDVAVERAARAGVPCVLVSPIPTLSARTALPERPVDRTREHAGWCRVRVVDRRDEPPGRLGLFSEPLAEILRRPGRAACILNRVGRVRLLACVACGELTTCDRCDAAVHQQEGTTLDCARCGASRPPVCAHCGGARLKNLVLGVGRAREELEALIGEPVGEVTASAVERGDARVVIGTEALLRQRPPREHRWERIVFLDFDQHLAALRQGAEADAMALLVLAARLLGERAGGRELVLQTRRGDHPVVVAARRGDPSGWLEQHDDRARSLRWPPAVSQAEVSGAGAPAFMEELGAPLGLDVLGPVDGRWLIRSDDRSTFEAEIAAVPRGEERLRLEVW